MEALGKRMHTIPLLPLRGILVFPTTILHLDVGRERSVDALEHAMMADDLILLAAQKEAQLDDPSPEDVYTIGTVAKVRQMLNLPNGTIRVLVEGLYRARIASFTQDADFFEVSVQDIEEEDATGLDTQALKRLVLDDFERYLHLSQKVSPETYAAVVDITEPGRLADAIASHLPLKIVEKQRVLEVVNVEERLKTVLKILHKEIELLDLEKKINTKVKKQLEQNQREYHLREQLKAIQRELGDTNGRLAEVEEFRLRMAKADLPKVVEEKIEKELSRLERTSSGSSEGSVISTYIDWLIDLPWRIESDTKVSLEEAEQILDQAHYGLGEVKERILEYIAVQQMVKQMKGPILCLVGPPGVGKTSLADSVAKALGCQFVRVALGGIRDEAEIRGHRRTYVGAMPGRIIQGIKKAGTWNPVFLLDEIDKMAGDSRGDPASALLEVLDPSQNPTFSDHYIELPFDLSRVTFIATANAVHNIPPPLLDRLEMIYISGYTEMEKEQIAKTHLLPKQLEEHGLTSRQVQLHTGAITKIIQNYTHEAGVRTLERTIGTLCRKAARRILQDKKSRVVITPQNLPKYLGAPKYRNEYMEASDQVGTVTGLAWTEAGGSTLSVEVSLFPGKGQLILTGQLGDVMKESAQAAFSFIRSRAEQLQIDPHFHETHDIHIHVPKGAIPKDGPSAGVTLATALVSALTKKPVSRYVAMTGEITLHGRVLPVGGIKEKALGAHRTGISHVLIPRENEIDLEEIPSCILQEVTFTAVDHIDEVLERALVQNTGQQPTAQANA